MQSFKFRKALPVWGAGLEKEMNVSVALRTVLPKGCAPVLYVTGHSDYQIFINGAFLAQGPARAGHGFFRVDALPLSAALTEEQNVLCILCAGYNVNSFYLTDQPPFLCAEIVNGETVLFATGTEKPFEACVYPYRMQKVQRYSFQRPFTEAYRFPTDYDRVFTDPCFAPEPLILAETGPKRFLVRETPRSDYEVRKAVSVVNTGVVRPVADGARQFRDRAFDGVNGKTIRGFRVKELELAAVNAVYRLKAEIEDAAVCPAAPLTLPANGFAVYDMGLDTTGYLRLTVAPAADAVLWAVFNEKLQPDGLPDPGGNGCACEVCWKLQGGRVYELTSFEPYTYRYVQVICENAAAEVRNVSQICEHYPAAGLKDPLSPADPALHKIYAAAVETFRQNATDIFMDCPSRERAGWLCDSFFTARTERAVTGESRIEKAFLENFLMEESFPHLPAGMLPMCYPSDHYDGCYIPNWAMWYLLELAEYKERTGDTSLVDFAKDKMYALAAFFEKYENGLGLLEKLDSWVFVEWSRANDFTQDVNFPTNMLYAKFLETLGCLYGDAAFTEKAARLKETIRETAFNGSFFIDNAVRKKGTLKLTGNHTETAQYYAFFTGVATKETYPALYGLLLERFGPGRDPEKEYPDVPVSNAFIGNYLRLEILYRNGEYDRLIREIRAFFLPMAEATGTLWENMTDFASCCHGFASCVAYWMHKIEETIVQC